MSVVRERDPRAVDYYCECVGLPIRVTTRLMGHTASRLLDHDTWMRLLMSRQASKIRRSMCLMRNMYDGSDFIPWDPGRLAERTCRWGEFRARRWKGTLIRGGGAQFAWRAEHT